ncbi:MAG TPA: POTRA domain-containing protein [Bryobacteraceae bacterium]|nr:POTRA domain-containing protein [Bryobacteraceae bacterium]
MADDVATADTYEGKKITRVQYDPPSQPVLSADLARLVPFHEGDPLHLADVRDAIKRLYGTGRYSYIEIDTVPVADGVTVTIRTTEQWFVGPVEVHGKVHTPPNEGQLANATRLDLGTPFNEEDLQTAQKGISDLLQRNGLYMANVKPKIDRDPEHQQVSITFQVDSGKRARLTLPNVKGDSKIPDADLAKAAKYKGWFRWKLATDENTQAGAQNIRKKFDKADRLTGSATVDHVDYDAATNRITPTIEADSGPKIKIQASGAKISKSNLQTYVPVFDEQTVNRDLLVSGVRNLHDYFQSRGYFDVEVDFNTKQANPDEQDITYTIALGERHKVVKVDVQGNRYFKTADIKDRMFLQPAGFVRLRHGRYTEGFARRDEDSIKALYRDNGFRDAKVTTTVTDDYKGKTGEVALMLTIEEGLQYLVSSIDVDGITRPDKSTILAMLSSVPGQPFSDTSVAMDRDYILTLYQSKGYPDTTFDWRGVPGPGPHQMALHYTIVEGQPKYIRDVLITGLHTTRQRLIAPDISLKAGDPLAWTEMGNMQRRLYNLGVFDKVDMAIQNPDGDTESKYVLYHLTEGHRYSMAVGLGAEIARIGGSQTSLDAPAGATGFAPRGDLELSRLNLWGLGHSLNFKGRYSTLDRRISLNYLAPRYRNVDGRNISVTALYDNTRDVLTFTARRIEGSAQISQKLSKASTLLLRYTWRNVEVDQSTLKITPNLIPLVAQPARVASISGNLIQDRRDDPADAHRGYYNTVDLGLVEHYFGGNKNFLRTLVRNSYYKTIFTDIVIASNTEFGWIHPFNVTANEDAFVYVPIAERFFGGGSTSMRGFPDNQAGPRDAETGFPLGGNALLFHSTEARFPFLGDNIQGVIFHDMGNVYTDLSSLSFRTHQNGLTDFDYMVHAVGFGIRYKTPVGPVRIDLAYSINPPTFNGLKGTYQQLLFGTATPTIQSVSHFQFFFSIGQAF